MAAASGVLSRCWKTGCHDKGQPGETSALLSSWNLEAGELDSSLELGRLALVGADPLGVGLPDSTRENIECLVQFEFEIQSKYFLSMSMSQILNET